MTRPNVWLSIDFDYFVPEDEEWDLGHLETPLGIDLIWAARLAQYHVQGIDLRKEMSLRKARPCPGAFWRTLQDMGYSFDKTKRVVVADSHRWAYFTFDSARAHPTQLVHFDAHHDLFYSVYGIETSIEEKDPGCDNWQIMTLLKNPRLKSLIVYPAWKGMREWESSTEHFGCIGSVARRKDIRDALKRATPSVWPNPHVAQAAGNVERIFICRSGAWVPPWHDQAFRRFCSEIGTICGKPVETPYMKLEDVNPLRNRKVDYRSVKDTVVLEMTLRGLIGPTNIM